MISLEELGERRARLTDQRRGLERQVEQLEALRRQRTAAGAVASDLAAFCERVGSRLDDASFADKQAVLRLVVERIIVHEDSLEARHVIPLRSPSPGVEPKPDGRLRSDRVELAALPGRARQHGPAGGV